MQQQFNQNNNNIDFSDPKVQQIMQYLMSQMGMNQMGMNPMGMNQMGMNPMGQMGMNPMGQMQNPMMGGMFMNPMQQQMMYNMYTNYMNQNNNQMNMMNNVGGNANQMNFNNNQMNFNNNNNQMNFNNNNNQMNNNNNNQANNSNANNNLNNTNNDKNDNEILPREDKTLYEGDNKGYSQGNLINIALNASSGLKVIVAISPDCTIEELILRYAQRAGVPKDALGTKVIFLFNGGKMEVDSQEKLSKYFKNGAVVTVIDQGGIIGA
jgi:hypothetical protein